MKSCKDCRWAILQDHGYSNYTVEGTDLMCAGMYHPEESFDVYYGEAKQTKFAEECAHYEPGEPPRLEVEGGWTLEDFTAEQREALELYSAKSMLLGRI